MQERLRPNNGGSGSATLLFLSAFILFCSSLLLIRLDAPVLPNPQFLKFKCCTTEEHEAAAIKYFQNVALNREQKFYIKSALSLSRTTGHLEFYLLFLCLVLILVFFIRNPTVAYFPQIVALHLRCRLGYAVITMLQYKGTAKISVYCYRFSR